MSKIKTHYHDEIEKGQREATTKDRNYLINWYNATSTDDGTGEIETYEAWLERQLLSRIERIELMEAKKVTRSTDDFFDEVMNYKRKK